MDANQFDALSRAVGAQNDRRGLLKRAAVGGLGLLGLAAGGDDALAKKCKNNGQCPKAIPCRGQVRPMQRTATAITTRCARTKSARACNARETATAARTGSARTTSVRRSSRALAPDGSRVVPPRRPRGRWGGSLPRHHGAGGGPVRTPAGRSFVPWGSRRSPPCPGCGYPAARGRRGTGVGLRAGSGAPAGLAASPHGGEALPRRGDGRNLRCSARGFRGEGTRVGSRSDTTMSEVTRAPGRDEANPASRSRDGAAACPSGRPEPSKHTPMRSRDTSKRGFFTTYLRSPWTPSEPSSVRTT